MTNRMNRPTVHKSRRQALRSLAVFGLGLAASPLLISAARAQEAPYEVLDLDWADASRQRPVPVRLYLPHSATAARKAPLIVFSHGIGGSRRGYRYLGTHWAQQGWASLHLQHVGSDRALWSGSPWSLLGRLQTAAQEVEAIARAQDLRFALDQVLAGEHGPRIDADRIAAGGHSYGANTTLLATGARVEREGREIDLADPRLRAAIVISAPPFYGEGEMPRILSRVTVPSLHITATDDVIRIPGYFSGLDDRIAVFEATGSRRKLLAVFEGGSHSIFTDRSGTGGAALNPKVKAATQDLSAAFLRSVFEGDETALGSWPQRHAGLIARYVVA